MGRQEIDPFFSVKLLHFLGVFLLILAVFLLQLVELRLDPLNVHHALFGLDGKGKQDKLCQKGKGNYRKAVTSYDLIDKAHYVPKWHCYEI